MTSFSLICCTPCTLNASRGCRLLCICDEARSKVCLDDFEGCVSIFFLNTFVYRIMYLRQIAVAIRAYGTEVEEGC